MILRYRRALEKDIPRIGELLGQVNLVHHLGRPDLFRLGRKYTDGQLRELLLDGERPVFAAADENDTLVGYALCIVKQSVADSILTDVRSLYIDDLCVDEACRGAHIGSGLLDFVAGYARENGFYNLTLNVWDCNEPAKKFYEAYGMKPQKLGMELIL